MSQRSKVLGIVVVGAMAGGLGLLAWERRDSFQPSNLLARVPGGTAKSTQQSAQDEQALGGAGQAKGGAPASNGAGPGGGPPVVTVARPTVKRVVEWDDCSSRFEAVESVDIRARVSGYLKEVHFKDGQIVKQGDLLSSIDPRPFERALEQAKAGLAQATTKAENTSLDVERGRPLVDRKIMSEKVFDDRTSVLRDAQASIKVAEANVRTAELDLMFTNMTAPIGGRSSRSTIGAGSWVSAGAAANASMLTSIASERPIHIYFDISENNRIKYRRMIERGTKEGAAQIGRAVEIALPDESGYLHRGRDDFLDNRLDQASGTLRARAILDNPSGAFSPGMHAPVRVQGADADDAILIPDEATGTDQTNRFAMTVSDDGSVTRDPLVLGPWVDELRVIRSGFQASDTIILKGLQRARPGAKVTARPEAPAEAGASRAQGAKSPPPKTH